MTPVIRARRSPGYSHHSHLAPSWFRRGVGLNGIQSRTNDPLLKHIPQMFGPKPKQTREKGIDWLFLLSQQHHHPEPTDRRQQTNVAGRSQCDTPYRIWMSHRIIFSVRSDNGMFNLRCVRNAVRIPCHSTSKP